LQGKWERKYDDDDDYDDTACRVLVLATCSGPINSLEVFRGVVLGFVSHTVDISQLSVAVCLSVSVHSPNMLHPFISVIFNFLYNWANFEFWQNIFTAYVILPRVFCCSHKFHFRWRYPVFILFSNCPKVNAEVLYIYFRSCAFGLESVFKVLLIFPVIWRILIM